MNQEKLFSELKSKKTLFVNLITLKRIGIIKGKSKIGNSISLPLTETVIADSKVPKELNPIVPKKRIEDNKNQLFTTKS